MRELTKQDVIDLLYGCTVLGTGGGGGLEEGLRMMEADYAEGKTVKLVSVHDIPDEAYVATPYGCGAPAPAEGMELEEKYKRLPLAKEHPATLALKALEKHLDTEFFAVSSTEQGGLNTAEALHVSCILGLPVADADPAGRSVPELQHSTYFLKNVPIAPMGLATKFGDVAVLGETYDDFRAEQLVRAMAVASDNLISVVDHPAKGSVYRESVIVGAHTYALEIGETLRMAKAEGKEVPVEIANKFEGKVLFKGEVTAAPWEMRDGFIFGDIIAKGEDEYEGEEYRIWFQNENLMSYRNGKVDVTCPDLICAFDGDGNPITNPDTKVGTKMTVIALPAPEIWKTKEGLECFGPKYFGFDVEYTPFTK